MSQRSRIESYSMKNRTKSSFPFFAGKISGIAVDGNILYLANPNNLQIYALEIIDGAKLRQENVIGEIRQAQTLGAITTDTLRRRVLVTDSGKGGLYAIPFGGGKAEKVTDRSEVTTSGMAVRDGFIFLGAGENISVLNSTDQTSRPTSFRPDLKFTAISGLAVDENNALWVADFGNHSVQGPIPIK